MRKIEHLHKMQLEHGETQRASRLDIILKAIVLYDETFFRGETGKEFETSIYDKIKYLTDYKGHLIITWNDNFHKGEEYVIKKLWDLYGGELEENVTSKYSTEYCKKNFIGSTIKISLSNLDNFKL